jgi:1-acyl-sn-glycerol-3-phosphate acyltransferase
VLYELAKPLVGWVLRVVYRPRIEGLENLPALGGVVVASNHLAGIETVLMPCQLPRTVHFLAKADFFRGRKLSARALGLLLRGLRVMPVDRSGGQASDAALDAGLGILREGKVLGIYPEGTRSPDGRMYRGHTGMVRMALLAGVPIVPIAMQGTFEAQRGRTIFPHRLPVMVTRMGRPVDLGDLTPDPSAALDDPAQVRALTDLVMERIREMSGQEYVDRYAADVKRERAERTGA